MLIKVRDLLPNPFRRMERYPIRREKVDALKESLRKTGFWDNVVARPHNGQVEIAYGHHRLVALREEYGAEHEVSVILRDLDDAKMLQVMAAENMEEWGTSAWVEMETVAAVIQAYEDGKIDLPPPARLSASRRARGVKPYDGTTVAEFLGWKEPGGLPSVKVYTALGALDLIAQGVLSEADFAGLGSKQAEALLSQTRRGLRDRDAARIRQEAEAARREAEAAARERQRQEAERDRQERAAQRARDEQARAEANRQRIEAERKAEEARRREERARRKAEADQQRAAEQERRGREAAARVGKHVSAGLRSGDIAYKRAGERADEVLGSRERDPRRMDDYALQVARAVARLLSEDSLRLQLDELLRFRDQLSAGRRADLVSVLGAAAGRFQEAAERFSGGDGTEPLSGQIVVSGVAS